MKRDAAITGVGVTCGAGPVFLAAHGTLGPAAAALAAAGAAFFVAVASAVVRAVWEGARPELVQFAHDASGLLFDRLRARFRIEAEQGRDRVRSLGADDAARR